MKRDLDLIRKILLAIENRNNNNPISETEIANEVQSTNLPLISFHLSLLSDNDYIKSATIQAEDYDRFAVIRLTSSGCDYLDNVRNEGIWNKTKKVIESVGGSVALDTVKVIAGKIIMTQLLGS